tara:strand:- start:293 stop:742 length:450 start_codon:yes stop_codon:yes gene_type:complete
MSDSQNNPYFIGSFTHAVDEKGRLTLPARWRLEGSEQTFLGLPFPDGQIHVLPPLGVREMRKKMRKGKLTPKKKNILMGIFAKGDQFECDKQGRFVLSKDLREHAGIEGKGQALMLGVLNTFTILNPTGYEPPSPDSIKSAIDDLNLLY